MCNLGNKLIALVAPRLTILLWRVVATPFAHFQELGSSLPNYVLNAFLCFGEVCSLIIFSNVYVCMVVCLYIVFLCLSVYCICMYLYCISP